ncbi:MAG: hypothetical protein ACPLKS_08120 [Caldisericum exile]|uniref:hypothetical protein n=1 Tax=Caldisericum exile TaxID=693075 RepID=UPI003C7682FD
MEVKIIKPSLNAVQTNLIDKKECLMKSLKNAKELNINIPNTPFYFRVKETGKLILGDGRKRMMAMESNNPKEWSEYEKTLPIIEADIEFIRNYFRGCLNSGFFSFKWRKERCRYINGLAKDYVEALNVPVEDVVKVLAEDLNIGLRTVYKYIDKKYKIGIGRPLHAVQRYGGVKVNYRKLYEECQEKYKELENKYKNKELSEDEKAFIRTKLKESISNSQLDVEEVIHKFLEKHPDKKVRILVDGNIGFEDKI